MASGLPVNRGALIVVFRNPGFDQFSDFGEVPENIHVQYLVTYPVGNERYTESLMPAIRQAQHTLASNAGFPLRAPSGTTH